MQLYKGFDVGTAKVSKKIRNEIPHHLLDVLEIHDECTASKYISLALPIGKVPIIVGGTHMYMKALIWESIIDYQVGNTVNPSIKDEEYSFLTSEELHKQLLEIDPERASSLHINDRRKIIRGIEVNLLYITVTILTIRNIDLQKNRTDIYRVNQITSL
ncbi:putative tRNA delta(2)-isopentenylpyrophosphate transferase [Cryptosporidium canis]|uniref:tRNA delta(2)-isopentenylpyrophosphate transferase n=1 Tax=Cryptosporidium canis TaxID=195482 RepID=A0A9D5HZ03_9CRYT|nr:putative tRNA delta(2)-isopentenylpyrophosphate transferase [Cryptosporidium canis]